MIATEIRRQMRARKLQLRKALPLIRKAARARVEQLPAVKREKARRRIRRALALVVVAILLLLIRCQCGPELPPAISSGLQATSEPQPQPRGKDAGTAPKKSLSAQGSKQNRGNLGVESPQSPAWIDQFQLQVAARSPRLAQCFTGIDRPGALRWAASVNPQSGAVSDQQLEPVGLSIELSPEQRGCLLRVLSNPNFRLGAPNKEEALPNRISLVIEF